MYAIFAYIGVVWGGVNVCMYNYSIRLGGGTMVVGCIATKVSLNPSK